MVNSCKDCPFCYADEENSYPYCHFEQRTFYDVPPCEYEEETEEEYF